jgi:lipoprotein-anchoring transpeptidase ErfK/SrfK
MHQVEVVSSAIMAGATSVDLEEQGCYETARVMAEDTALVKACDTMNKWVSAQITYDWNGNKVVVDGDTIHEWIQVGDRDPQLDEEAIAEFVSEQAKGYDTYGKKRKFTTVQGIELNLPSGAYGWKTDREEEIKALTEAIQNGETVDKEPAYISKGAQKGSNDIGNSYVEIDLTNQHLYLFRDGDIVLETDFVSGNMSKADCVTPPGVFGLTYKTRNAILRGANYETPVNYWMPFNGNIGMHDATWRRAFGGTIYLTSGSHGCINLPLHMAASIYEYVSTGFPVVCYYY